MPFRSIGLTLCALLLSAGAAQAQVALTLRAVGERESSKFQIPISQADCEADINFDVQLTSLPTGQNSLLIVWGNSCEIGANRIGSGAVTKTCFPGVTVDLSGATSVFEASFTAKDLGCDAEVEVDATRSVYFIALPSDTSSDDVDTSQYVKLDVEIDTKAPPAPTGTTGGSGETVVPVDWDFSSTDVNEFRVYWDPNDEDCSSTLLVAGMPVVADALQVRTASSSSRSKALSNAVDVGQRAAVGVVAVDLAGNESVLSNVACIEGVPTSGFWDEYQSAGGDAETGCSVTRVGGGKHGALLALMGLTLLTLVVRSRRRHS